MDTTAHNDPQEESEKDSKKADVTSTFNEEQGQKGARMSYRVEYRHFLTDKLVHERLVPDEDFDAEDQTQRHNSSAFELVTVYQTFLEDAHSLVENKASLPGSTLAPSHHLRISSLAIINAIRSVVRYYPSQDLTGDVVKIRWPYAILAHYYDELSSFRDNCAKKDAATLCAREKDAYEHLGLLFQFLDKHVMVELKAEKERNERGMQSFENFWLAMKPGVTVVVNSVEDQEWRARVVHSVSGGVFENPPVSWEVEYWGMAFDGTYVGRESYCHSWSKWDGERDMHEYVAFLDLDEETMEKDSRFVNLVKNGEAYWSLLRGQCRYHKGKTTELPFNEVDGLVMVDLQSFYHEQSYSKPALMNESDGRNWISDCTCTVCRESKDAETRNIASPFERYNHITVEARDALEDHMYLLCPREIHAFVFRTRTWESLLVSNCFEPTFNRQMIENLVMDERRVRTLKALAKSFARTDKNDEPMKREAWVADFVKGKGNGLIFLLHGRPGVGKTCTAECIAEFTGRPLMVLTCSDIGTDPATVEWNLTRNFKTARSWGAVLLIDEADVFMSSRTTTDLTRNSLVAGFLRALEFYDGILFLTTNRVGSFDDSFVSRVHIQLYYPDFTDEQRQQVWKTFIDKLGRERGDYMRLNIDAKEYIRGSQMKAVKWNGRDIRNAFQTAVALAEYDAEKDEDGKILLTDGHLRAVTELSKDFKEYLDHLHQGDEGKRAERKHERLDRNP